MGSAILNPNREVGFYAFSFNAGFRRVPCLLVLDLGPAELSHLQLFKSAMLIVPGI